MLTAKFSTAFPTTIHYIPAMTATHSPFGISCGRTNCPKCHPPDEWITTGDNTITDAELREMAAKEANGFMRAADYGR